MPNLIIALVVVFGGLWLIRKFARITPAVSRGLSQKLAGGGMMAFSGFLALRGNTTIAVPLFLFGLGLLGKGAAFPDGFHWGKRSAGQKSRVATSLLAMELDHDTGAMKGEVLAGPFKGRNLAALNLSELQQFHEQCRSAADQSRSLLEAWLDRAQPAWREEWGKSGAAGKSRSSTAMSRDEALAVLGLKDGATADDVRAAHKRLMKDFHPDLGGSDYLAAKINAAKDVLLGA